VARIPASGAGVDRLVGLLGPCGNGCGSVVSVAFDPQGRLHANTEYEYRLSADLETVESLPINFFGRPAFGPGGAMWTAGFTQITRYRDVSATVPGSLTATATATSPRAVSLSWTG